MDEEMEKLYHQKGMLGHYLNQVLYHWAKGPLEKQRDLMKKARACLNKCIFEPAQEGSKKKGGE